MFGLLFCFLDQMYANILQPSSFSLLLSQIRSRNLMHNLFQKQTSYKLWTPQTKVQVVKSLCSRSLTMKEFPSVVRNIFFIPGSEGPEKENTLLKLVRTHTEALQRRGVTARCVFSHACTYGICRPRRPSRQVSRQVSAHARQVLVVRGVAADGDLRDTHTHTCTQESSCSDPLQTAIKIKALCWYVNTHVHRAHRHTCSGFIELRPGRNLG